MSVTPASPLGPDKRPLELPQLQLGQVVVPGEHWERDFPYFRKCFLRHLIRRMRNISFRRHGKFPEFNKEQIRDCMRVFDEAKEFEVAGLAIKYGYNVDTTSFNACYLGTNPGMSSGPTYGVQLLIRFERNGKRLAMITGDLNFSDHPWTLKPKEETAQ